MQPYQKVKESRKQIFINNIIGGVGWAIGATVGLAVVLAILGFIAHQVNVVPVIGTFISAILNNVQQQQYLRH